MILVKLQGGLSNQMFQYAAALRLAQQHGTTVRIDTGWYRNIPAGATPRHYELHHFSISGTEASAFETIGTNGVRNTPLAQLPVALWRKVFPRYRYVGEKQFHFDETILALPDNVCLFGYWVSEKYFTDIDALIRREFTVRNEPDAVNAALLSKIKSVNSIALHVRRGDYVQNPEVNAIHGTCGIPYYQAAVAHIAKQVNDPHFFIFSDDIEWVKHHLPLAYPVEYVTHNQGPKSYEDIRLMSCCRHNIIANSGFSWWGAWLNTHPEKIVIAPEKWFGTAPYDTRDVIPASWIKLP